MIKDIKAIKGRYHIASLIEQGEHECQDFKHSVSDASKIAHSLSAFANNRGGRLLIGVRDNGSIAGVRNEEDIYVVRLAAESYCRPEQQVDFRAYNVDKGTVVIVAEIAPCTKGRPVMAREHDGSWRAYYRVADENIVAHPLMVRGWQRAAEDTPVALGDSHRAVLAALERLGATDNQGAGLLEVARMAHMSTAATESAVADLLSLSLVAMRHTPRGFVIVQSTAP